MNVEAVPRTLPRVRKHGDRDERSKCRNKLELIVV